MNKIASTRRKQNEREEAKWRHSTKKTKKENSREIPKTESKNQERRHTTHTGELQKARTRVAVSGRLISKSMEISPICGAMN